MRATDPAIAAHLSARKPIIVRHLIWITARHRLTLAPEAIGFWDGDDHHEILVEGETRTYYAAGALIKIDQISHAVGTDVRRLRAKLAPMAPEVEAAIRGSDARTAPVQVHRLIIDPETMAVIGSPVRRLDGRISEIEFSEPDDDGSEAECRVTIATAAIEGTRTLALKKSDESQKLRALPGGAGGDRFFRYADVSGKVPVKWGEE